MSVCLFTFEVLFTVFLPPLPEDGYPIFLEIRNPWVKVIERSGLRLKNFAHNWCKIAAKKVCFCKNLPYYQDFFVIGTTIHTGREMLFHAEVFHEICSCLTFFVMQIVCEVKYFEEKKNGDAL